MADFKWETDQTSGDQILYLDNQEKARIPADTVNFIIQYEADPSSDIAHLKNYFEELVSDLI
jgi:hypothetical protein